MSERFSQIVDRVPEIASTLAAFESEQVQLELLRALLAAIGVEEHSGKPMESVTANGQSQKRNRQKSKTSVTLDKQLDLANPQGTSFRDFATSIDPRNNQEKLLTAVYWLELEKRPGTPVTVEQVVTCFNHMSWRQPANPRNALAVVASEKGWLDTGNAADLRVTIAGKNHIDHDIRVRNGK